MSRKGLLAVLFAYVVLSTASIAVGFLIVDHVNAVRDLDLRVARWLGHRRTGMWDDATWVGSGIADLFVKVPAAAVLSLCFVGRWRRWNEATMLIGPLALEAAVFVTASFVVDRARPPISQLDSIPLTSSFPSGHTAAAVAFYGAIAVVVHWHARRRIVRRLAVLVALVLVVVVGASRMYRGMHHLSDVVVGALLGAASLWVVYLVVRRPLPGDAASDLDADDLVEAVAARP
jgi:membrane-associated phospholipid phosphatase